MANFKREDRLPDEEELERLLRSANQNIADFFCHKSYFCGGSIPERLLFSKESIEFVMGTNFIQGIQYAQDVLLPQVPEPPNFKGQIAWDVHAILELVKEAIAAHIPIDFQAGVILLDFKFCQGCSYVSRREYLDWLDTNSVAA